MLDSGYSVTNKNGKGTLVMTPRTTTAGYH